jgi:hypothetical protein
MSVFDIDQLPDYDFIFTNHFMHHFPDSELPDLLGLVHRKTRIRFLMNDLKRSRLSYLGFTLFATLFLHNSFAGYDGGLSILRGFTSAELQELVSHSDSQAHLEVGETFPGRVYIFGHGNKADPDKTSS